MSQVQIRSFSRGLKGGYEGRCACQLVDGLRLGESRFGRIDS